MMIGKTNHFTLGHSPDPDDAFMFYAIAKDKIDLRGYRFEHRLEDIQTLNERAQRGELHISAISIHAYPYVADKYALLPCGAKTRESWQPSTRLRIRSLRFAHYSMNCLMGSSPNCARFWES